MKTVLIVEDEEQFRKILSKKLTGDGFGVLEAANGEQALNLVKNSKVDLILLDLLMPNMDGFMFFYKMHNELGKKIPTIILTNLEQASYQEGISEFLVKSNTSLDEISGKIKKHLGLWE